MTRTCSRCGHEFTTNPGGRICDACRKPKPNPRAALLGKPLTPRERQIIRMLTAEAHANKEIAYQLHLSEGTVKEYMSTIYKKVGLKPGAGNRTLLAIMAVNHPEMCAQG